ncbi:MAG: hypothetical protein ACAF41_34620 (plasmid) [Leptolyngbya sp. BL-A-14]
MAPTSRWLHSGGNEAQPPPRPNHVLCQHNTLVCPLGRRLLQWLCAVAWVSLDWPLDCPNQRQAAGAGFLESQSTALLPGPQKGRNLPKALGPQAKYLLDASPMP